MSGPKHTSYPEWVVEAVRDHYDRIAEGTEDKSLVGIADMLWDAYERGQRDPTAELRQQCVCNKCGWCGVATGPHYWHDGCNYSAITALDMERYENRRLRDDTAELVEALEAVPIVRFNEPGTDGFLSCPGCGATGSEPCEIDCYAPKVEAALAAYRERNK